jgi:spermidine dehydrogenase
MLSAAPLPEAAKRDIERLESGNVDYLPGLSPDEKKARLSKISYREFLLNLARVDPAACKVYQARTHDLWCVGIDAVSALDCWATELPGFQGMGLAPGAAPRMGYTASQLADHGWSESVHFPDGNATVARALLRNLIPESAPGKSVQDLITARVDYSKLDRANAAVRLRLNATAVEARNVGPSAVAVTYVRDGNAFKAHARHCVLACWNAVIPYLPGFAGAAESRASQAHQDSGGLRERRIARLAAIREARHPGRSCARWIFFVAHPQ